MDGADFSLVGDSFSAGKPSGQEPGLGLNVVCGIIKKYGGTINYDTKESQGDFRVHMPMN
jgi:nitrogen-specific signal transduction histidine kinase